MKTIVIIGGGASGMMAAITASQEHANHVILLERQSRIGRKLLSTGNGRCNLTNIHAGRDHYHGADTGFILPAMEKFGVDRTLEFFRGLGLITTIEQDGRVYPLSNHAASVLDVLRFALERDNIELFTDRAVLSLRKQGGKFLIDTNNRSIQADHVVITCGGAAGSDLGGVMDGYELLEMMGHKRTAINPSLVQINTDTAYPKALKGVKADASVSVIFGERVMIAYRGEVLFTDFGVSGPAIFEISRTVSTGGKGLSISLDLLADYSEEDITGMLTHRCETAPKIPANQILTGALQNRLGQMVCKYTGVSGGINCAQLTFNELHAIAYAAKHFMLGIEGTAGFECAQVTAGGMSTSEFDPKTMESRIVPGLFACGEVLDIDGDCGGYNLQWAWSSGHLAGELGK
ncbi:MAG: NAD(P)/FAD-dependent oxidoreductase [Clostridia bacterium]